MPCLLPSSPPPNFPGAKSWADFFLFFSGGNYRPGDYLQAEDDEVEGFKLRLNERLAPVGSQFSGEGVNDEWQIGDTLAQWWRPNFETFMYPFLPAHVTRPKECKKLYLIQLPKSSMWNFSLFPFSFDPSFPFFSCPLFSRKRRREKALAIYAFIFPNHDFLSNIYN